MSLWDWAVARYARPGVAAACLALQDDHDQCVPLLLWRCWALEQGRTAVLASAVTLARTVTIAAVEPLRRARRRLKPAIPGVADVAREALRARVGAAELEAERLLLEALESLASAAGGAGPDPLAELRAVCAAWRAPAPDAALRRLLEAAGLLQPG